MPDREIVEETKSGYRMIVATAVRYRGPDGSFVDRDAFVDARNREIRGTGYGRAEYGAGGYGH